MGNQRAVCVKGDNCSFRHDVRKRAKMTQPNPPPSSFMQMRRGPEVPEVKVRVVDFTMALQGLPQRNWQ